MQRSTCSRIVGIIVLALVAGAGAAQAADLSAGLNAAPAAESFPHPYQYLLEEGWETIAPDVLRRELGDGRTETYALGVRGLRWAVQHLVDELEMMERDYTVAPSVELLDTIVGHERLLASARARLNAAEAPGTEPETQPKALTEPDSGCDVRWGYHAYADPGASARADANFYSSCYDQASTYAYAYVKTTTNGTTKTRSESDPSGPGWNVSSNASESLPGTADSCYSYARAYVDSPFGFFEVIDKNYDCDPLTVYISGPSYVYEPYSCSTYTWTAKPSGGTGSYTNYQWTFNGYSVGSNSATYSRTYCATPSLFLRTDQIGVTVTDSSGATAQATKSVSVELGNDDQCIEPQSGKSLTGEKALEEPCIY